MSRAYYIEVEITGYDKERRADIEDAASDEWGFDNFDTYGIAPEHVLSAYADGHLGGGESEEEFALRFARAVFKANGGPCIVEIRCTYMENLPFTRFRYTEEDWKEGEVQGLKEGEYNA